jgi:hypothetical protein
MHDPDPLPPEWYAAYPGTRYFPRWNVMAWTPRGVLDASRAETIIDWLEAVEPHIGDFNRFIDFSLISRVELDSEAVADLAIRRREGYAGGPVKTAIFADSPLTFGIARMYELLLSNVPIQVHVVSHLVAAADVLGVPVDVLERAG